MYVYMVPSKGNFVLARNSSARYSNTRPTSCMYIWYRPKVTLYSLVTLVHDTRILVPLHSRHWCTDAYKIYKGRTLELETQESLLI